jgi:hypothetical protein
MNDNEDDYYNGDDAELYGRRKPSQQRIIKAVLLAFLLTACGVVLLTIASFVYLGKFDVGANGSAGNGSIPFFIAGCFTFVPGFYHLRIAYYAWYRREGFEFAEIPDTY